ncbi:MAG: response regulator transcription factor [Treponema sp.]|nr:response regulator transcription factor [Treponema sp.]
MEGTTVLVVDDEAKILEIVKTYLQRDGYTAFTAQTGAQAMSVMRDYPVSMLILDLMLPDMTGEEICRAVREQSEMPIIMMTAKTDEESVIGGLRLGADDYVTKPFSPRQLMARVSAALRRSRVGGPPVDTSLRGLHLDEKNRRVSKDGKVVRLTPSEYRILALLMSTPHKIFTRDEIIYAIKPDDYDGFDRTIDTHIKNLRHKIEDDLKSPRYVVTMHGFGYRYGDRQ